MLICRQLVEQGPSHMRTFVWECTFHNMTAQGQGRSKKDAKNAAAKAIKIRSDMFYSQVRYIIYRTV